MAWYDLEQAEETLQREPWSTDMPDNYYPDSFARIAFPQLLSLLLKASLQEAK